MDDEHKERIREYQRARYEKKKQERAGLYKLRAIELIEMCQANPDGAELREKVTAFLQYNFKLHSGLKTT